MKYVGSDIKSAFLVLGGVVLAFPLFIYLPLVLPFLISSILLYFGVRQLNSYKELKNWEKTKGTLLKTEIAKFGVGSEYGRDIYYFPLVYFSFIWEGSEQKSNKYAFDNKSIWSQDSDEVTKELNKLKSMETLEIYVNPKSPSDAVVNITISKNRYSHTYALLVSGVSVALLGLFLLNKS